MLGWLYQNQLKIIYEQSNLGIAIKNSSNYLHTSDHLMKRALFWTGVVYNICTIHTSKPLKQYTSTQHTSIPRM